MVQANVFASNRTRRAAKVVHRIQSANEIRPTCTRYAARTMRRTQSFDGASRRTTAHRYSFTTNITYERVWQVTLCVCAHRHHRFDVCVRSLTFVFRMHNAQAHSFSPFRRKDFPIVSDTYLYLLRSPLTSCTTSQKIQTFPHKRGREPEGVCMHVCVSESDEYVCVWLMAVYSLSSMSLLLSATLFRVHFVCGARCYSGRSHSLFRTICCCSFVDFSSRFIANVFVLLC